MTGEFQILGWGVDCSGWLGDAEARCLKWENTMGTMGIERVYSTLIGGDWNMTCIFPYIGNQSSQLFFIFFGGVETTNQYSSNCSN